MKYKVTYRVSSESETYADREYNTLPAAIRRCYTLVRQGDKTGHPDYPEALARVLTTSEGQVVGEVKGYFGGAHKTHPIYLI